MSTSTHGSGIEFGPIADSVRSLDLVASGGRLIRIEREDGPTDPAAFQRAGAAQGRRHVRRGARRHGLHGRDLRGHARRRARVLADRGARAVDLVAGARADPRTRSQANRHYEVYLNLYPAEAAAASPAGATAPPITGASARADRLRRHWWLELASRSKVIPSSATSCSTRCPTPRPAAPTSCSASWPTTSTPARPTRSSTSAPPTCCPPTRRSSPCRSTRFAEAIDRLIEVAARHRELGRVYHTGLVALRFVEGLARLPVDDARARHDDDRADPGDRHRGRLRAARRLRGGAVRPRRPPALGPGEHARRPAGPHVPGVRPLARGPRGAQRDRRVRQPVLEARRASAGKRRPSFRQPSRGTVRRMGDSSADARSGHRGGVRRRPDAALREPRLRRQHAGHGRRLGRRRGLRARGTAACIAAAASSRRSRPPSSRARATWSPRFVGAAPDDTVVFVRNTTEAINVLAAALPDGTRVLSSTTEHHANMLPWRRHDVRLLPFTRTPDELLEATERALRAERIDLVAVTGASNVTGEVWPVGRARRGSRTSTAPSCSSTPPSSPRTARSTWRAPGIDHLALSGHKLYAPFGSGALVGRLRERRRRCSPAAARSSSSPSTTSPGRPPRTASRPARPTRSAWSRWPPPAAA